jgi:hypothetical protein
VTAGPPLVLASFTADKASPQIAGTPITATATPSGGGGSYQYRWWLGQGGTWTLLQDWTASNAYTWTPSAPGSYTLHVWVRSTGTSGNPPEAYGSLPFTVTPAPLPTVSTPTAAPASPQLAGTPITFTATASGGVAPLQYKWFVALGGVWTLGRDWGTSNTFPWTPTTAGAYSIQVWVRNSGSTADAPEAYATLAYVVTAPLPNLSPYRPAGWSDAIVVASTSGSFADAGTYAVNATYYLQLAVMNFGPGNVAARFYVDLYDNSTLLGTGYCDNLPANYYCYWANLPYTFTTPGTHALRIVVDTTGAVAETNEGDNVYTKTITVSP